MFVLLQKLLHYVLPQQRNRTWKRRRHESTLSIEWLEGRQVLSAISQTDTLAEVSCAMGTSPSEPPSDGEQNSQTSLAVTANSSLFPTVVATESVGSDERHVDRSKGRKKDKSSNIKPWQGTWNINPNTTGLGGQLVIQQTGTKAFTFSGLDGATFGKFKSKGEDDLRVQVKLAGVEGKQGLVALFLKLDTETLKSFDGTVKRKGGGGGTVRGDLVEGTSPEFADVKLDVTAASQIIGGKTFDINVTATNLGPAALPGNGSATNPGELAIRIIVTAENFPLRLGDVRYVHASNVGRHGFATVTPGVSDFLYFAVVLRPEPMLGPSSDEAKARITLACPEPLTAEGYTLIFTYTWADTNASIRPGIQGGPQVSTLRVKVF